MHDNKELHNLIAARIKAQGPMPVAEYMGLAAEAYYARQNPFGIGGDFTTAPEISQMFGEMTAAWLVDVWMQMGKPADIKLIELGPGRGTLAADIMRTLSTWPALKEGLSLHLVETSPRLRDVQAETLKKSRAAWYTRLADVPRGPSLIVANEFFDALPIHQLEKTAAGWQERCVGHDAAKDVFYFTTQPLGADLSKLMPPAFMDAPAGSIFEISPVSLTLMQELAERLARDGGAALIADYGHSAPGLGDTLQAISRHQYSSPLEGPGLKDITAHVDFATLKTVAEEHVNVFGPVQQGQFLISLGIEARAEKLCANASPQQKEDVMVSLCRLVARKEMGRLFKVMALTSKNNTMAHGTITPAGFGPYEGIE